MKRVFTQGMMAARRSPLLVWERLAALGCRLYQGYLYSPALPLDEFMAFAAKYTAVQPAAGREKQPAGME